MTRHTFKPCILITGFALILSCAGATGITGIRDFPAISVGVTAHRKDVRFNFSWQQGLPEASVKVHLLIVHVSGGPTIWRIINPDGKAATDAIVYGNVPTGYLQTVPEVEKPPLLMNGQKYVVTVEGEGGLGVASFIYQEN